MTSKILRTLMFPLPILFAMGTGIHSQTATNAPANLINPAETQCGPSLPITIAVAALGSPAKGRNLRLQVTVASDLDPDLVTSARLEYELPAGFAGPEDLVDRRDIPLKRGRLRRELDLMVPDEARHEIRARIVFRLANGKTISQTATCWIDPGEPDPPAGMIGRIQDRDGAGIRVYQGVTVRDHR